jgi:hypothetical protein
MRKVGEGMSGTLRHEYARKLQDASGSVDVALFEKTAKRAQKSRQDGSRAAKPMMGFTALNLFYVNCAEQLSAVKAKAPAYSSGRGGRPR